MDEAAVWQVVFGAIQALGLVSAAMWSAWRFQRERVDEPHAEFSLAAQCFGPIGDESVLCVYMIVKNPGRVQVKISDIVLRIRGVDDKTSLQFWSGRGGRLYMPQKILTTQSIKSNDVEYFFY